MLLAIRTVLYKDGVQHIGIGVRGRLFGLKGTYYTCPCLGLQARLFPERSHFSEFGLSGAEMTTRASLIPGRLLEIIIITLTTHSSHPNVLHFRYFLA